MVQKLQAHSSDKWLEDARQVAKQLQEFRQRKTKELIDQLQPFFLLGEQTPKEETSVIGNQRGSARSSLVKDEKEKKGKGKWESFQEARLAEMEKSYRGQILEEKAKMQDQLEKGELKKWLKEKLLREHDETLTFLDRAFQQDMQKQRGRVEVEKRRRQASQEDGSYPISKDATVQEQDPPSLAEGDKVNSLLAEYVKMLRHTELLVLLRTTLLNPQLRSLLSEKKETGDEASSHLLALLNDVNQQLRHYAAAAGFLNKQPAEKVNSFQDIMSIQMTPKSRELVPVATSSFSARELVIYQYGIVLLQFLRTHIGGPDVNLGVASSIPSSDAPGNAFRNTFYYQIPEQKLFVLRECLSCVGSFILLLVHCRAHIAADDLGQDSSPAFQRLFYQALKACLGEMFSLRLQTSAMVEETKSAARMINEVFLNKEVITDEKINLLSGLFESKVKPSADSEKQHQESWRDTEIEDSLKTKRSPKKEECHSSVFPNGSQETVPPKSSASESCSPISPGAATRDVMDVLTEKLVKLLKKEREFPLQLLKGSTCEDQLMDQAEATALEKASLLREIQALEGKAIKAKKA
uniref:Uncharacterized protein isoform X1 n=1 Tax=Pogona vitticeps TaxID=103695 RepID=A0ABM5EQG5_9SAUR